MMRLTMYQKSQPMAQPMMKAMMVLRENWKETAPPKKPFMETMIAARMPKERAVPTTMILKRSRSLRGGSVIEEEA